MDAPDGDRRDAYAVAVLHLLLPRGRVTLNAHHDQLSYGS